MTKEFFVQYRLTLNGDLLVAVESDDNHATEEVAVEAIENEYPGAQDIEIINISEKESAES